MNTESLWEKLIQKSWTNAEPAALLSWAQKSYIIIEIQFLILFCTTSRKSSSQLFLMDWMLSGELVGGIV